jgi:hypothetical protein
VTDAITAARMIRTKLSAKAEKLEAQLAAVRAELDETDAAIRFLSRHNISPTIEEGVVEAKSPAQARVMATLPSTSEDAKSPKDVYEALVAEGVEIKPDNVRTILYRAANPKSGKPTVASDGGRYWRIDEEAQQSQPQHNGHERGASPFGQRPDFNARGPSPFDDEFDPEVPF